jgi:hypothetical protein
LPPPEDYDENDIIMDELEDGEEGSQDITDSMDENGSITQSGQK